MPLSLIDGALDGITHCLEVFYGIGWDKYNLVKEITEIAIELVVEMKLKNMPVPLKNAGAAIREALENSLSTYNLDRLIAEKLATKPGAKVVIVVSDNTRTVPYRIMAGY